MNRAVPTSLTRLRHPMALVLGLLLGQIVALMAQREGANWQGFGISTVFVAAASASFVLYVLGQGQRRTPVSRPVLVRQAQTLAVVIGLGLLASLNLIG
ncbi:MAG: hypothetical protein ABW190_01875 [Rhizobacter sp.]